MFPDVYVDKKQGLLKITYPGNIQVSHLTNNIVFMINKVSLLKMCSEWS